MSEFPGYMNERQVRQHAEQRAGLDKAKRVQNEQRNKVRAYTVLNKALPLLRQYGRSLALPAEIPCIIPLARPRVSAAWVVESWMSSAGNISGSSYTDQSATEQLWAITEDGLYGQACRVDRGVPALKYFSRPKPLSVELMTRVPVSMAGGKPSWQLFEEA